MSAGDTESKDISIQIRKSDPRQRRRIGIQLGKLLQELLDFLRSMIPFVECRVVESGQIPNFGLQIFGTLLLKPLRLRHKRGRVRQILQILRQTGCPGRGVDVNI